MRISRKEIGTTVVAMLSVGAFTVVDPGPSSAAGEPPPWGDVASAQAPPDSPLAACVAAAKVMRPSAWTCLGGQLSMTTTNAAGELVTERREIVSVPMEETKLKAPMTSAIAVPGADDYDAWCESGTICTRLINDYTSEVKGNAAYGDQDGVIGSFDQVLRQSFSGDTPRWRGVLIWDGGPAINGNNWHIRCRKSDAFSDSVCGDNPWDPGTISSSSYRTWIPTSSGYRYNSESLSGSSNKYHDDFYGRFTASGESLTWSSGTLHTGRWKGCPTCKYYQVPWTSSP